MNRFTLKNIDLIHAEVTENASTLHIEKGLFSHSVSKSEFELSLKGYSAYPGLFNAHDHLFGTWLPKVGNGPYLNWKPWDDDLKNAPLYKERNTLTPQEIYNIAYYRQILSGVTTVSDHIPHKVNSNLIQNAPIRVVEKYALSHEVSSYDLGWGGPIENEIARAKRENIPFLTHIEEGFDEEAMDGVPILKKLGGLNRHAVLVHCVSCDKSDISEITNANASMVWCPVSNIYMYNKTANIKEFLKSGANVSLGTDSPMSGGVNLLAEMKFARDIYSKTYNEELDPKTIYKMVTQNPAKAFFLEESVGSLSVGHSADLLVLKNTKDSNPYEQLINAEIHDIELLISKGVPLFGKKALAEELFKRSGHPYDEITINRTKFLLWGSPIELLKTVEKKIGFKKELEFLPIEF